VGIQAGRKVGCQGREEGKERKGRGRKVGMLRKEGRRVSREGRKEGRLSR
jgi:hypothetical protein